MAKNKGRQPKKPAQPTPKVEQKTEVTEEVVKASTNEADFESKKSALFKKFEDDLEFWVSEKKNAEDAAVQAQNVLAGIKHDLEELGKQKESLARDLDDLQAEYDKAVETIDSANNDAEKIIADAKQKGENEAAVILKQASDAKETAENEANAIRESAEAESLQKLKQASDDARKAWQTQIDDLKAQIEDISKRERELHKAQTQLEQDREDFQDELDALNSEKEANKRRKERYEASNPEKVADLEQELIGEKNKYALLLEKYGTLQTRLGEAEVLLDSVKAEIEDGENGKRISSMSEIVAEMRQFKEKYEKLAEIYSKYPDDKAIADLEDKAMKADRLQRENIALESERDRYREEAGRARSASKELEVIRQEVEATNALNEHLLQELESHKTALESRTGDTCPSLSKVDTETEESDFVADISKRMAQPAISTLKELVSHVKNYAGSRSKEEQLYYTDNDIRAFLAGMAVSRLIILQGMSGTGKSSLPRIFSEAISGFDRLIPVESSWRDRNELLGYYNDFNKKFNAKGFTIELYRSSKKRCQEIPTFIVLDEMNLARIEYYFSDFLAILQEPDHGKWLIELVSSDMRTLPMELPDEVKQKMKKDAPSVYAVWEKIERSRQGDLKSETSDEDKELLTSYLAKMGKLTGAKDLIDGRKIKVTDNIWFIGTANQDESTFEISDKVYDRAQVVSLNKKGVSEGSYPATTKKYISVSDLQKLFDTAIASNKAKAEVEDKLEELDMVLMDKFDTSFGNRIVTQTVDFAAVFIAAGGKLVDALDYQISTKILRKIISSDDQDAFLDLLEVTAEYPETQRLINKRIKELR